MTRTLTRDEQRDLERRVRMAIDQVETVIRRYGLEAVEAEAGDAVISRSLEGGARTETLAARVLRDGARALGEAGQR